MAVGQHDPSRNMTSPSGRDGGKGIFNQLDTHELLGLLVMTPVGDSHGCEATLHYLLKILLMEASMGWANRIFKKIKKCNAKSCALGGIISCTSKCWD